MKLFAAAVVGLALAGCVSTEERAQQLAPQHDAQCKSMGARPGTPDYTQCRMFLYGQLARDQAERRRLMAEGLDDIANGLNSMNRAPRRNVSCSRTLTGGMDCTSW